ncbi:MAG: NADH-quinone oxidoreductase subunit J [bacterium]
MEMASTIFFWLFATGAVLSSIAVVTARIPLYSAIALILDFFFFAGLYVLLSAHFMAIIQVLVYGGAIMVLFMFIIMLLNLRDEEGVVRVRAHHAVGLAISVALAAIVGTSIWHITDLNSMPPASEDPSAVVAVPSRVPGLYGALDEDALRQGNLAKISKMVAGQTKASDGKYRPVDPNQPTVVPPMISGGSPEHPEPAAFGTVEPISLMLINRFVVPFELTAMLLLGAIVGAVIIAKKRL